MWWLVLIVYETFIIGMWLGVTSRIDTTQRDYNIIMNLCLKENELRALDLIPILEGINKIRDWGGAPIWPINEHMNLNIKNEDDSCMNFKDYEESCITQQRYVQRYCLHLIFQKSKPKRTMHLTQLGKVTWYTMNMSWGIVQTQILVHYANIYLELMSRWYPYVWTLFQFKKK